MPSAGSELHVERRGEGGPLLHGVGDLLHREQPERVAALIREHVAAQA